jgi:hypothetical protein
MRDQQIGWWFGVNEAVQAAIKARGELKTPALQPVAAAFDKNMSQAAFLSRFPGAMCRVGQDLKFAEVAACIMMLNQPYYEGRAHCWPAGDEPDEATQQRWREEADAVESRKYEILDRKVRPPIPWSTGYDSDRLTRHVGSELRNAYDTLMSAQLVLVWTAFETLAGDLWEAAVNTHPQTLASLAGKSSPNAPKGEGKSLPMSFLERHHYDLRDKMGTILREHRCRFTSLEEIVKSYRLAFPEGSRLHEETFWEDGDVKSTTAIRNLTVHKAGLVDQEFKDSTTHDNQLAHWKIGEQFYLDGVLLRRLIPGLFEFSYQMVRAADDWINANPT